MPYCTKCGSEVPREAEYCPTCGTRVKIDTIPPTYPQSRVRSSSLFDRMIRAAKLDPSLYEEVEGDNSATTQAFIVVILSSICSGIGTAISKSFTPNATLLDSAIGLFGGLFSSLIAWFAWSAITYFVGTRVFSGTASVAELLRTLGFSNSSGVLQFFSFIPILGGLISFAVWIWGLIAMVVAVRQALDFSTGKAILTCIVGWIVAIILLIIIGIVFAIPFLLLGS